MKVLQVLRVDAGLYYGGGEVQAERTRDALINLGVDVRVHGGMNADLGDVVHFFGLFDSHWEIAEHCLRLGVPYVVSPIFVTPRTVGRLKWRSFRQRHIDFQFPKKQWKLLQNAQQIYPLTKFEKTNIQTFFPGLSDERFHSVPNGVEDRFAHGDPSVFRREFGIEGPFILHAATIERSKNQLGVIQALKGSNAQGVFIGRVHDEDYWKECQAQMTPSMRFLGTIPHAGEMLPSTYAAADVFCLPSRREILPLSAMEATVAGCRLILGSKWGGQEIWEGAATFVDPDDVSAIRSAALAAMNKTDNGAKPEAFLEKYRWSSVATRLQGLYELIAR